VTMTFLKQAVKICLVYIVCLGLSTACFIGLFHVSVLKFTSTFFYNGCLNLFLSSVLCALLMFAAKRLKPELIRISDIVCAFWLYCVIHSFADRNQRVSLLDSAFCEQCGWNSGKIFNTFASAFIFHNQQSVRPAGKQESASEFIS